MKIRTWPALASGFGTVVLLIVLSGLDSWQRASQIYSTMLALHKSHARAEQALHEIHSGVYISGILVRDFLLDRSPQSLGFQRQRLLSIRSDTENQLAALSAGAVSVDPKILEKLRSEIARYWDSLDPVFDWTARQKLEHSAAFLRREVLPRRFALLDMANEARTLNAADLAERQKEMDRRMAAFRRSGQISLMAVIALALAASAASIFRVSRLESRAEREHARTERAEMEMRRLSRQVLHAQEEERRRVSRELHDEVGQTLTALGVELGNLQRVRTSSPDEFQVHLDDARQLTSQTLAAVRNMAMGLRPSVLDDLGLAPALHWQAREFSRRTGVPVEVSVGKLDPDLPEEHRTCVYRVAQEALTNCARHSGARHIVLTLEAAAGRLNLAVADDGRGLPAGFQRQTVADAGHMGLVGVEERVRELGGALQIDSQPDRGTLLRVSIPVPHEAAA